MNIAVFASGNGTNFEAIAAAARRGFFRARLKLLVCDNPEAGVLARARRFKIKSALFDRAAFKTREGFEAKILARLDKEKIGLIVLAGFMKILSPNFVRRWRNRTLNIHPAILPAFKGMDSIKRASDYGCKLTGVTVHFVDEEMDHGPIIFQQAIPVPENVDLRALEKQIHALEHKLYPMAVKFFVEGRLKVEGRKVQVLPYPQKLPPPAKL